MHQKWYIGGGMSRLLFSGGGNAQRKEPGLPKDRQIRGSG